MPELGHLFSKYLLGPTMCLAGSVLDANKRMMKRQSWSRCSRENR